jgi:hypothetical protein
MAEDTRPGSNPRSGQPAPRKAYKTPRLEEYGHVAKLTQSGGSTRAEPGNSMGRQCL